ncbi:hypothetical protein Srubr_81690 [Streptomyces rubradiris]|uniref:Uncharacterized protein n=1 Tax=Streptomyces rubradiris TaxID=285531 RepID=A0ABQ3RR71_STRRR|nr:hypothetical protein GCM10018792_77670 [Streptomyces rubradiris]GHI51990.1 hypothetical protein Srubr_18360 [Streptomyces rubradiris]GHI52039.1 hypothetical protein Srubr_18850 [Streptomyces rubradiris]GHI52701.1 hypothetical protein Srubr_25470 [Streptomyces rubradiris]GHI52903.1 hypothetical protein Srubr_27490 [Streptomyces rubradiris]
MAPGPAGNRPAPLPDEDQARLPRAGAGGHAPAWGHIGEAGPERELALAVAEHGIFAGHHLERIGRDGLLRHKAMVHPTLKGRPSAGCGGR